MILCIPKYIIEQQYMVAKRFVGWQVARLLMLLNHQVSYRCFGCLIATFASYYNFLKYAKLWELERKKPEETRK